MAVEAKPPKNLLVSFSKRRQGLLRKAAELCLRCDAQVAVLVVSPSENTFAFGHSSVDDILRRYGFHPPEQQDSAAEAAASDRRKRKERELEELRVRARENNNNALENCKTVQELEALKASYLSLLLKVRRKLEIHDDSGGSHPHPLAVVPFAPEVVCVDEGLDFSGNNEDNFKLCYQESGRDYDDESLHGQRNDMSFPFGVGGSESDCVGVASTSKGGGGDDPIFDFIDTQSDINGKGFHENDMSYLIADYAFDFDFDFTS